MVNRYPGKDLYFAIDDSAGTLQQITGITSVSGLPGRVEHHDATAIGDNGRKHASALENVVVTVEGWYDDTATTGSKVLLSALAALRSADQESTINYGPKGNASSAEKISAETKLDELEYPGRLGDLIGFRATLLVQGTITIGSFT
jgi:hypothetical protein|tara:strand:+ start:1590 stop:2027 length:438 start_codon:yes stop_codon:yes gene_type:complete